MSLDLLALGILAVFVTLGALRGALAGALGLARLTIGYGASLLLGPACGPALAVALGAPPLLALPIGGAAAFAVTVGLLGLISQRVLARERVRRGESLRAAGDRLLGAAFGALRGGFVALLLGWLGLWLPALELAASGPAPHVATPQHVSLLAQGAIQRGADALLAEDDTQGRITARMLARPVETLGGLRGVLESPRVEALRDDAVFWEALEAGDVERALGRGSFRALAFDTGLRRDLAALGLVDAAAEQDATRAAQELGAALQQVAPRLKGLREDPELQALLDDPAIRQALSEGRHGALLQHPGFQRLAMRLASGPVSSGPLASGSLESGRPESGPLASGRVPGE